MTSSWKQYRLWSSLAWLSLLAALPAIIAMTFAIHLFIFDPPFSGILAFLVWVAASSITWEKKLGFPCPRCGRPFFLDPSAWYPVYLATHCVHCDLRKWADPNEKEDRSP
jgi:endogenous inhibitor of DNA gyrase (YacG/DUF329 family)